MAIAKAIEEEIGDRRGNNQFQSKEDCQNFAEALSDKRKDEIAAERAGFGNNQYTKTEDTQNFAGAESAEIAAERAGFGNNQHTSVEDVQNFAHAKSIEIAAERAGFGNKETYRQAKITAAKCYQLGRRNLKHFPSKWRKVRNQPDKMTA